MSHTFILFASLSIYYSNSFKTLIPDHIILQIAYRIQRYTLYTATVDYKLYYLTNIVSIITYTFKRMMCI